MKIRRLVVWCSILLTGIGGAQLLACGDKTLVPSRGMRFDLTPAVRRQANVLVYLKPGTSLPALFTRLSAVPALQKSGYEVTLVTNKLELDQASTQRVWDVVVVDLEVMLRDPAPPALSTAAVLVVAVNATKPDLKHAKGQYCTLLKSPSRSQSLVFALDRTWGSKVAAKRKSSQSC